MNVICLDPGHGGSDPGACNGELGLMEKDLTLDVCLRAAGMLRSNNQVVVLTRTTDVDVAYPDASVSAECGARCDISNDANADVFISVHINAAENVNASGIETFYYEFSPRGSLFAHDVQVELASYIDGPDRGTKITTNLYVLKHTDASAILVELGFISNEHDARMMQTELWKNTAAECLVRGILKYLNR